MNQGNEPIDIPTSQLSITMIVMAGLVIFGLYIFFNVDFNNNQPSSWNLERNLRLHESGELILEEDECIAEDGSIVNCNFYSPPA